MPQWNFFCNFFCNSTYSYIWEHWIIQGPVYVLHLITCHRRIMPLLAELLFKLFFPWFSKSGSSSTDISKYFRKSLGFPDNGSWLYMQIQMKKKNLGNSSWKFLLFLHPNMLWKLIMSAPDRDQDILFLPQLSVHLSVHLSHIGVCSIT